jgi:CHAT domain-containing protein/tetratricopeptide (TPR) repeat protein
MLISFLLLGCPKSASPFGSTTKDQPQKLGQHEGKKPSASGVEDRDNLLSLAEAKAARAAALKSKQTSKDFAAAVALLRESARLFLAGHWSARAAEAQLQIGEIYFTSGSYDKALNSYRQALTLAGSDREQRCRTLSHMARTYAIAGHASEAEDYSQQGLHACDGVSNPKAQAEALEARGEVLFCCGDSLQAVEPLSRARDLFAAAKDDDGQALSLLTLAQARYRTEPAEALRLLYQALRLSLATGNAHGAAQAYALLGTAAAAAGHYETARCNCTAALERFENIGDTDSAAAALNTLGFISIQTGEVEAALEYYRRARSAYASAHDWWGEPVAITGMGKALTAQQRYAGLLSLYQAKLLLAQKARNSDLEASAQNDIAGVYQRDRQYQKAEALYLRSLAGFRGAHNPWGEGNTLISLAQLYTQEGKYQQAISLLESARPLKEKAHQPEDLAKLDYELAYIYRRLGRLEDSLRAIRRTIDIIESQRMNVAKFESRAAYFASVHKYYGLYVQILMLLHGQDPQRFPAAKAFEASEKSKVRSLLDWLAGSAGQRVQCEDVLRSEAQTTEAADIPSVESPAPSAAAAPTLSLAEIQAQINDDDTVLLEYALGDEKSYLWAVNRQQILSYDLPGERQIQELSRGLRNAVVARQPRIEKNAEYLARIGKADADYDRYAATVSRLLLGPLQLQGVKRIIIVPDGPLQYVPFAALFQGGGSRRARTILIGDHEVITLPSASALTAVRRTVEHRARPAAIAAVFADPVFERTPFRAVQRGGDPAERRSDPTFTARTAWRGAHPGSKQIPRLLGSRREAEAVRKNLGPDGVFVAEDYAASRETVLHHPLANYRIVHFATHGVLDESHPERSGLILSLFNSKGEPQDGYLRLSDIYDLKLSADLVVLSSCDSALGRDLASEGIIGLPSGFFRAGAKSVIATLWKVDDAATAELMTHFYSHLRRGEIAAAALRNSQLELLRDERWRHPYYWAAFVFQGDYR